MVATAVATVMATAVEHGKIIIKIMLLPLHHPAVISRTLLDPFL